MKKTQVTELLRQLEWIFRRNGYTIRYVKGHFRGGACRVYQDKIVVINTMYPPVGRVRMLAAIAETLADRLDLSTEEKHLIERLGF
ncbi:MAG: hypothetical protein RMJ66_05860 [Bacteroidia bacterium]|nr:hypothetical protein [Bacteroidia bacterium]MDW8134575.1 hypothetical protein [Bacteroidia bacterium]